MAMEIDFEADAFDEGRHLRDVIRGHKGFSSALWKRIKWNGEVWLNGTRIHNAKTVLHEGGMLRGYKEAIEFQIRKALMLKELQ